jgi:hypothetical protein
VGRRPRAAGPAPAARGARLPRRPRSGEARRPRLPLSRVAVVTGGSSGIGAATARALAERGWQLVLLARGEERLRAVAAELGAEHERCDVSDRAGVDRVAAEIRSRHPAIKLLVNNAGIPGRGGFLDLEPEQVEAIRDACEQVMGDALAHYEEVIGDTVPDKLPMPLQVHRRAGEECPRCGTRIEAIHFKDYVMCYCPEEQTGGRVLKDRRLSRLLK